MKKTLMRRIGMVLRRVVGIDTLNDGVRMHSIIPIIVHSMEAEVPRPSDLIGGVCSPRAGRAKGAAAGPSRWSHRHLGPTRLGIARTKRHAIGLKVLHEEHVLPDSGRRRKFVRTALALLALRNGA